MTCGKIWRGLWEKRPDSVDIEQLMGDGYWVLDNGYWVLGTGYWVLVIIGLEARIFNKKINIIFSPSELLRWEIGL